MIRKCKAKLSFVSMSLLTAMSLCACGSSGAAQRNGKSNSVYELFEEGSPTTEAAEVTEKKQTTEAATETKASEMKTAEAKTAGKADDKKTAEADATDKAADKKTTEEQTTEIAADKEAADKTLDKKISEVEAEELTTEVVTETASGEKTPVELDLSVMSGTMVYSEVNNICSYPDDYRGKVIQMKGLYNFYHDDATGNDYYACIIQDATACCASGIEFVPDGFEDKITPGEEITVAGTFDTYSEGNFTYPTLRNAWLVSVN